LNLTEPKVEVQFGVGQEEIALKVEDFFRMYDYVAEIVVPRFARFFPDALYEVNRK
jgi:hypothetical protein